MAVAQSLTISGGAGLSATNAPPTSSTDFSVPELGLAYPDFDMRLAYAPDADDVPGSVLQSFALGVGTMPLTLEVHGTSMADLQTNRRALEAAFSQVGETVALVLGGQTETYPFFPAWPKWGPVDSGNLRHLIAMATLSVPVNPMVVS